MMMMMDPSYSFQFSNEDSARQENNDINGVLTGSYSYKTPGGEDIQVRYRAGADTGFVIDNMKELNEAIARSASEAVVETAEDDLGQYSEAAAEVTETAWSSLSSSSACTCTEGGQLGAELGCAWLHL